MRPSKKRRAASQEHNATPGHTAEMETTAIRKVREINLDEDILDLEAMADGNPDEDHGMIGERQRNKRRREESVDGSLAGDARAIISHLLTDMIQKVEGLVSADPASVGPSIMLGSGRVNTRFTVDKAGSARAPNDVMVLRKEYQGRVTGYEVSCLGAGVPLPGLRVLSGSFTRPNGVANGATILHTSRKALFRSILRTDPSSRFKCTIVRETEPCYTYFDLDADVDKWGVDFVTRSATPKGVEAIVAAVGYFFGRAFKQHCGGKEFPWSGTMWVFQCTRPGKKVSLHLHANPNRGADNAAYATPANTARQSPVWPCVTAMGDFIKQRVLPSIEAALGAPQDPGHAHAQRICLPPLEGEGKHTHMVDQAPYAKTQKVKLPVCRKPGKPAMCLLRPPLAAPTGGWDKSLQNQLNVGMITAQAWQRDWLVAYTKVGMGGTKKGRKFPSRPTATGSMATAGSNQYGPSEALTDCKQLDALAALVWGDDVQAAPAFNRVTRFQSGTITFECARGTRCVFKEGAHKTGIQNHGTLKWAGFGLEKRGEVCLTVQCFNKAKCNGRKHIVNGGESGALDPAHVAILSPHPGDRISQTIRELQQSKPGVFENMQAMYSSSTPRSNMLLTPGGQNSPFEVAPHNDFDAVLGRNNNDGGRGTCTSVAVANADLMGNADAQDPPGSPRAGLQHHAPASHRAQTMDESDDGEGEHEDNVNTSPSDPQARADVPNTRKDAGTGTHVHSLASVSSSHNGNGMGRTPKIVANVKNTGDSKRAALELASSETMDSRSSESCDQLEPEKAPRACCFLTDLGLGRMGPAYSAFAEAAVPLLKDRRASKKDKARESLAGVLVSVFGRGSVPGKALFVKRCQRARALKETKKSVNKLQTIFTDAPEAAGVGPLVSWVLADAPEKGPSLVTSLAREVLVSGSVDELVASLKAREACVTFVEAAVPLLHARRIQAEPERQALAGVIASVFGHKSNRGQKMFVSVCDKLGQKDLERLRKLFQEAREATSVGSLVSWVLEDAPKKGRQLAASLSRAVGNAPGATDRFVKLLAERETEWREHYLEVAEEAVRLVIEQRKGARKNKARKREVDVAGAIVALFGGGGLRGQDLFAKWHCSTRAKSEPSVEMIATAYQAASGRVQDPRAAIVAFVLWLQRQAAEADGEALHALLCHHAFGAGDERAKVLATAHERAQVVLLQSRLALARSAGRAKMGVPEEFDGQAVLQEVDEFNKWARKLKDPDPKLIGSQKKELKTAIVANMNKWFCAITKLSGKPMVLEEVRRPEKALNKRESHMVTYFVLRLPRDTTMAWEHLSLGFFGDLSPTNIIDLWRHHKDKRICHDLSFEPGEKPGLLPSGTFNMFRGLAIALEDAVRDDAAAQLVEDHVRTIWCSDNKVHGDYMLNWMAHLVQRPGVKMMTAPVLGGGQGAGKGIVVQMLGEILGGAHFISATNLDAVTGTFQEDKVKTNLLTFLDECTFAGDKKQASILKGLLSENVRKWEAKFLNPVRVKNHSNFIVASNYDLIVYVEKDDRRWWLLKVDNRYAGPQTEESKKYFDALGAVDPRALAWMLYHRDISTFNPRKLPPTQFGREQKSINFDSPMAFVEHILRDGRLQVSDPERALTRQTVRTHFGADHVSTIEEGAAVVHLLLADQRTKVPRRDVVTAYHLFVKTATGLKHKHSVGERQLFKVLRELTTTFTDLKMGPRGAQVPAVSFPPLSEARKAFQEAVHEPTWEWEE